MLDARINFPDPQMRCLGQAYVSKPSTGLYDSRGLRKGLQTELLHGQLFDIYERGRHWLWGQARSLVAGSERAGYIGYISSKTVIEKSFEPTHIITGLRAPVFSKPNIKSHITAALPLNAHISMQAEKENFVQLRAGGYIHNRHIQSIETAPQTSDFVLVAETFLNAPYIWGGTAHMGVDCSGLVQMSLCAVGIDAPRDADMQEADLGQPLQGDLKRGDLVFWPGHVAIMIDHESLIHANAHHMVTAKESFESAAARIGQPRTMKRLAVN